jgi:nucleotide-binding universal stress UspA family protein
MSNPVILVPLDGSEAALAALPVAKVLGQVAPAALRLLHVAEREPADAELLSRLRLQARALDNATVDVRTGEPATEILRYAEEMKPLGIILCKHSAPAPREMLGSTAASVLRGTSDPLVLVAPERGTAPWRLQHVLVPHDGTPRTSVGLGPAVEIAEHAGAELLLVHVADLKAAPGEPGSLIPPLYVDHPQHDWPAWTSEFVRRFASLCLHGHVHVRFRLAYGDPTAEVLRLVKEQSADLLLLAWRGALDEPRTEILNSLVAGADCPVMVVRA